MEFNTTVRGLEKESMIKTKDKGQTLQGVQEEEDNEEVGIKKNKK